MKYYGRKKYSKKAAEEQIENAMQMRSVYLECIVYWQSGKRTRSDILIESICNQTREEMISEAIKKLEYIESKIKYMMQFTKDYIPKGSFAIF